MSVIFIVDSFLANWLGFTSQVGLVTLEIVGFNDNTVSRYCIASRNGNYVTDDQFLSIDGDYLVIAIDTGGSHVTLAL